MKKETGKMISQSIFFYLTFFCENSKLDWNWNLEPQEFKKIRGIITVSIFQYFIYYLVLLNSRIDFIYTTILVVGS